MRSGGDFGLCQKYVESLPYSSDGSFFPLLNVPSSASGTQQYLTILILLFAFVFADLEDPVTIPASFHLCGGEKFYSAITVLQLAHE